MLLAPEDVDVLMDVELTAVEMLLERYARLHLCQLPDDELLLHSQLPIGGDIEPVRSLVLLDVIEVAGHRAPLLRMERLGARGDESPSSGLQHLHDFREPRAPNVRVQMGEDRIGEQGIDGGLE